MKLSVMILAGMMAVAVNAQTVRRSVMTDTNGVIMMPTNLNLAASGIASTGTVAGIDARVTAVEAWPTQTWSEAHGWGDHGAAGYSPTTTVAAVDARLADVEAWPTNRWSSSVHSNAFGSMNLQGGSIASFTNNASGSAPYPYIQIGKGTLDAGKLGTYQFGYFSGSTTMGSAIGAGQAGHFLGVSSIANQADGALQRGLFQSGHTNSIGLAYAASQIGNFGPSSKATIADGASGAVQVGSFSGGSLHVGSSGSGAHQIGRLNGQYGNGLSASNMAAGAVQILSLTNGQHALTTSTGEGSLLIGPGVVSNKHSLVIGATSSIGDDSISAAGPVQTGQAFWFPLGDYLTGDGTNLFYVNTLGATNALTAN